MRQKNFYFVLVNVVLIFVSFRNEPKPETSKKFSAGYINIEITIINQEEVLSRELEIGNSGESSGLECTFGFSSTQMAFKTMIMNGSILGVSTEREEA